MPIRKAKNRSRDALEPLGRPLSVSHRILAEYREFERFSTTVVNAYVAPRMSSHLKNLETRLEGARLRVMQSNGSAIGIELAREEPVRTILSGPAAGVIGAASLARAFGTDRFITFDMGGTSTDVSLFDRRARIRTLSYPDGYAVRTPVIDIHTVGAGGGSIARIDAGGSLRVGPESAGAEPRSRMLRTRRSCTVTDADLVAGRIVAENFLGGQMKLFPDRAERADRSSRTSDANQSATAARGVIRVVNANMERAIRVITVERGFDPRDFALAGIRRRRSDACLRAGARFGNPPNRAAAKSRAALRMGRVERAAGPRIFDHGARRRSELSQADQPRRRDDPRARAELADRRSARAIRHELCADMRYRGQSYELEVALTPRFIDDFHSTHRRTFGHSSRDRRRRSCESPSPRIRRGAIGGSLATIARQYGMPTPIARMDECWLVDGERVVCRSTSETIVGAGAQLGGPSIDCRAELHHLRRARIRVARRRLRQPASGDATR